MSSLLSENSDYAQRQVWFNYHCNHRQIVAVGVCSFNSVFPILMFSVPFRLAPNFASPQRVLNIEHCHAAQLH
jgi:hypothetical protein